MPDRPEPKKTRCQCGHIGLTHEDGSFSCNVCEGRGMIPQPWPGDYRQQRFDFKPFFNDPSWWEQ